VQDALDDAQSYLLRHLRCFKWLCLVILTTGLAWSGPPKARSSASIQANTALRRSVLT
jgi:hypothetical protein